MSLETAIARVAELNAFLSRGAAAAPVAAPTGGPGFAGALESAMGTGGAPAATAASAPAPAGATAPVGNGSREAFLRIIRGEVGQAESPPGSNNSPRIAEYRKATAGAPGPGPWCAYFVSWAARQAGMPIGDNGQGYGAVASVWAWAKRSGRAVNASAGAPRPGDLIVWNHHIGVVESVQGGKVQTIEGNSSDRVARRTHRLGDALGYVRMGA